MKKNIPAIDKKDMEAVLKERKIDWNRVLLAFLIGNLVFFIGIMLGYFIGQVAKSSAISIEDDIKNEFINLEVQSQILDKYPCSETALDQLSFRLDEVGKIVDTLEKRRGVDHPDVLKIKSLYTLFEIKHALLLEQRMKDCKEQYDVIWFFYSNAEKTKEEKEIRDQSQKLGFILSYLRNKYNFVRVYSIDASIHLPVTSVLRESFNVTRYPAVVVNDRLLGEIEKSEDVEPFLRTATLTTK